MTTKATTKRVCVIPGDEAAPEAVLPSLEVLKCLGAAIDFLVLPTGETAERARGFELLCRNAIDSCDTTLFGASSGRTPALAHLRWGKNTYANVRPVRYIAGASSPLAKPEGIDFVIVRENLEDLYVGVEGDVGSLGSLGLRNRRGAFLPKEGRFAIKVITEANSLRIARFAFELARKRQLAGHPGRVTSACKYNMLPESDGLFRRSVRQVADEYPDIEFQDFLVDDFARRIVANPHALDVVLLPNLYGDILSDEAAALVGGLGMSASGCFGDDFAYFEPVHGTAPDLLGTRSINPTATLLSAVMMLEYLKEPEAARRLENAIKVVYADGVMLTRDQGGRATSDQFCEAVKARL